MKEGAPVPAGVVPVRAGVTDEQLMVDYGAGSSGAFDTLYARHKGPLYRYFRRQLAESEANDCFQTLWLKVIDQRNRYRPDAPFRHYLFSLAHNVLMDHYRKSLRQSVDGVAEPDELLSGAAGPQELREQEELQERLQALIQALPTHQREVWLLRQETDFSTADIARVTDASEEGVKSRLRYARDKLKQGMARYAQRQ